MTLTIYHNPRCSKSRQTLARIEEAGVTVFIRKYYDTPMSHEELTRLLGQLGYHNPRDLMRTKEKLYKELGLKEIDDNDRLVAAMLAHPQLIERPIVTDGKPAVLGRPSENVDALL
jgi:arsenate reductase